MWLIIQIAAGIILAYVIIRNGAAVWKYSLGLLAVVGIGAVVLIAGSFANDAASDYGGLADLLATVMYYIGLFTAGCIFLVGVLAEGQAVATIFNWLFSRDWEGKDLGLFFAGTVNFFLTGLALQGFDFTSNGPILGPVDAYSRSLGLNDTLPMLVWFVASLWVLPVGYWVANRGKWPVSDNASTNDEPERSD